MEAKDCHGQETYKDRTFEHFVAKIVVLPLADNIIERLENVTQSEAKTGSTNTLTRMVHNL